MTTETELTNYFTLNGVPIRVITPGADMDYQLRVIADPYIGQPGSNTTRLGNSGKLLKLTITVRNYDDIDTIRGFWANKEIIPLVSPSKGGYNVLWRIMDFKQKDRSNPKRPNHFDFDVELHEHSEFNVTNKNFTNWKVDKAKALPKCPKAGVPVKENNKIILPELSIPHTGTATVVSLKEFNKATVATTTPLNCVQDTASKNSQLNNCPTLVQNNKNTECNKTLQRALRSKSYYIKYNGHLTVIDGIFGPITYAEVRRFQKNNKLTIDGIVGPKTKAKL